MKGKKTGRKINSVPTGFLAAHRNGNGGAGNPRRRGGTPLLPVGEKSGGEAGLSSAGPGDFE